MAETVPNIGFLTLVNMASWRSGLPDHVRL